MEEYLFLSFSTTKFPKSGVSVWVGVGQLPLLPPGSAGPLRVIVVGVKRDFVEFF